MGRDIILGLDVAATPDQVIDAITTQEGQASFWTTDCDVADDEARFGFPGAPVDLHMRVEQEGDLVRWRCDGQFPGWDGSIIEWQTTDPQGGEGTGVVLRHLGLTGSYPDDDLAFGGVGQTWSMILERLQTYLRDGQPVPYFT